MAKLEDLRDEVEAISHRVVALLNQRTEVVLRIAREKRALGLPVRDAVREDELVARLTARSDGPLGGERLAAIVREILRVSVDLAGREIARGARGDRPEGDGRGETTAPNEPRPSLASARPTRPIPQYDVMRTAVFDIASSLVRPGTSVVDVGCRRGDALEPLVLRFGDQNRYLGLEASESMRLATRDRFATAIGSGLVDIQRWDLREGFPATHASVIQCVLTLQFVPIEHRQRLVRDMYEQLAPGGGLVLVERVLGASAEVDKLLVPLDPRMKTESGYTEDEVERSRLALEGVLVPVTASRNEELLRVAGFRQVDCFWRWMNCAAWIAVKD